MNLYEHTIAVKQDASPAQIEKLREKYSKIVEINDGNIVQTENWGLLNLSYIIKKNKKATYIHFKIKGTGKIINELEKNESIDQNLLRYMTVKVKKFNLKEKYFSKDDEKEKKENNKKLIMIKRKKLQNKKSKQSNFAKLSIFQNNKYKFKKSCPLSVKGAPTVDYKNIKLLKKYISENGKILPSRITNVCQKKQRELSLSIKRARNLALI